MGVPRTIGAVAVKAGTPTPVYTGTVISAVSFSISNGIAKISLGAGNLPATGYNGPNGFPVQNATTGSKLDIQGKFPAAGGQQVMLWGFTTATYFNGVPVTVLDCDPASGSFRFYFNHANVGTTSDAGKTAARPFQHYRSVRLECSQSLGGDFVYVGDKNVSSSRYVTALSLAGQLAVEIASENIPADAICIDGTTDGDSVQVSLIY